MPTTNAIAAFDSLTSHLKQWFHSPDIEALEIALAVAASHFSSADPTWLFVVGPPATGKTSAIIQALKTSPSCYIMGDLTPQTFLSGKKKLGEREPSLLMRLGSAVLLMKDFTTLISKRPDDRAAIVSQLREIYDGTFSKDTGETARLYWTGKMTVIAACTPAIERQWALLRDLGERFVSIRWMRESGLRAGRRVLSQCNQETTIAARTASLGKELLSQLPKDRSSLSNATEQRIIGLAELVACGRGHVTREAHSHAIISVDEPEGPARILKAMRNVLINHAAVQNRDCTAEDIRLAVRIAMDTIPSGRHKVLTSIPPDAPMKLSELQTTISMPPSTLEWHLDELESLALLKRVSQGAVITYEYTDYLNEVWHQSFPSTT